MRNEENERRRQEKVQSKDTMREECDQKEKDKMTEENKERTIRRKKT